MEFSNKSAIRLVYLILKVLKNLIFNWKPDSQFPKFQTNAAIFEKLVLFFFLFPFDLLNDLHNFLMYRVILGIIRKFQWFFVLFIQFLRIIRIQRTAFCQAYSTTASLVFALGHLVDGHPRINFIEVEFG